MNLIELMQFWALLNKTALRSRNNQKHPLRIVWLFSGALQEHISKLRIELCSGSDYQTRNDTLIKISEVEQLVARRAHNPEAVGSNPSLATTQFKDP